jgi:hypothetical protein
MEEAEAALDRVRALAAEFDENPLTDWDAASVAREIRSALEAPDV